MDRSLRIALIVLFVFVFSFSVVGFVYSPEIIFHCQEKLCSQNLDFSLNLQQETKNLDLTARKCSLNSLTCVNLSRKPDQTGNFNNSPIDGISLSYKNDTSMREGRKGHSYYETFHVFSSENPYSSVKENKGCWKTKISQETNEYYIVQWTPKLESSKCYSKHSGGIPGKTVIVNKEKQRATYGMILLVIALTSSIVYWLNRKPMT